jgi:hypothetical protein
MLMSYNIPVVQWYLKISAAHWNILSDTINKGKNKLSVKKL